MSAILDLSIEIQNDMKMVVGKAVLGSLIKTYKLLFAQLLKNLLAYAKIEYQFSVSQIVCLTGGLHYFNKMLIFFKRMPKTCSISVWDTVTS